jgi:hypothetical protein
MKTQGIKATSMVLGGVLLTSFSNLGKGFASEIIVLIGFVVFLIGLRNLKEMLDEDGKGAVGLIYVAAIIGAVGALIGLIPMVGIIASLALIAAFIVQLIGYLKLKNSNTIGEVGAKGANLLVISMIVALIGGVFRLIPAVGGIIGTIAGIVVLIMVISGWRNIQKGIIGEENVTVTSLTLIMVGMLLQLGNEASRGWGAAAAALIGLILLLTGLKQLKANMDDVGKAAVKMITLAIYIGILASVLDIVASFTDTASGFKSLATGDFGKLAKPSGFQIIVSLIFIAGFIVELLGFLKLKSSSIMGENAKSGITFIVVALILGAAASLFSGVLPIGGKLITSLLGIAGILLVLFGWLKVQEEVASRKE